jgi:rubrerythrin
MPPLFTISKLKIGRSPREMALAVARAAEDSVTRFYRRLAESTKDAELKALYEEFVAFETNHSGCLEQKSRHRPPAPPAAPSAPGNERPLLKIAPPPRPCPWGRPALALPPPPAGTMNNEPRSHARRP